MQLNHIPQHFLGRTEAMLLGSGLDFDANFLQHFLGRQ